MDALSSDALFSTPPAFLASDTTVTLSNVIDLTRPPSMSGRLTRIVPEPATSGLLLLALACLARLRPG